MQNWKDVKKNLKSTTKEEQYVLDFLSSLIGAIITERKTRGLSQKDLAEMANVGEYTIIEMETSVTKPNIYMVLKVASVLDIRYSFKYEKKIG